MGSYEEGAAMRRRVLGDEHVDRATAETDGLDSAFQAWITESVWGGVWSRPGLDLRTRSLITIAILAAMGHEELTLHLRAAANTGVSPADLTEVLLHVAAYAGAPSANHGFRLAKSVYGSASK